MLELSFKTKHIIVCGSTRGIGRATAELLAYSGARLTLLARNQEALAELKQSLPAEPGIQHAIFAVDFNDTDSLRSMLSENAAHFGDVTGLINNSGGPPGGLAINANPDEFIVAFERHLIASQLLVQAVVPGMKQAGFGRIVNVISTSVKSPIPGLGVSNTIRGAVASWAKTLANELGPSGITVNNVLPGATATDRLNEIIENKASKEGITVEAVEAAMKSQIPARRFADASETASAIAFLTSEHAGYINGINLPVDGGRLACL